MVISTLAYNFKHSAPYMNAINLTRKAEDHFLRYDARSEYILQRKKIDSPTRPKSGDSQNSSLALLHRISTSWF